MNPHLKHIEEFRELLSRYRVSDRGKEVVDGVKFVAILGPSSTGRNTTIRELLKISDDYHFVVSDTTRPPRINDGQLEQNGVDYYFISEEDMLNGLKNGDYL